MPRARRVGLEWTLFDLVQRLGEGRQSWAATISAGPTAWAKSAVQGPAAPREREALPVWLAASTHQLLDALREAGPDRLLDVVGYVAVAADLRCRRRHQLQEFALHPYDAQVTVGAPQPLPDEVALDGVDEFLSTCCATTSAWPHKPAAVDFHAVAGRSWRLSLSVDGARATRPPAFGTMPDAPVGERPDAADASARGTAGELVLVLYRRIPIDSLQLDGDRRLLDQLSAWDPDE